MMLSPDGAQPDGLAVVDVDPKSKTFGEIVHSLFMPNKGDEFHHFGWIACSSALSPLVSDIDISLDDRLFFVACWGTGQMHQYDVSDPMDPKLTGKVEIGGIVAKAGHPNGNGSGYGPQMVEISRDGNRVYWPNSLYST